VGGVGRGGCPEAAGAAEAAVAQAAAATASAAASAAASAESIEIDLFKLYAREQWGGEERCYVRRGGASGDGMTTVAQCTLFLPFGFSYTRREQIFTDRFSGEYHLGENVSECQASRVSR
jgi:hypothetical protein